MKLLPTPVKQFKFGKVNYDNKKGIGNVPANLEIVYRGYTCVMSVAKFLALTPQRNYDDESSFNFQVKSIKAGKTIGSPFLDINYDNKIPKVVSHEGRTRLKAIGSLYGEKTLILVNMFGQNNYSRAKELNTGTIRRARQSLVQEKSKTIVINTFTKNVFFNGKWIDIEAYEPIG